MHDATAGKKPIRRSGSRNGAATPPQVNVTASALQTVICKPVSEPVNEVPHWTKTRHRRISSACCHSPKRLSEGLQLLYPPPLCAHGVAVFIRDILGSVDPRVLGSRRGGIISSVLSSSMMERREMAAESGANECKIRDK